MESLAAYALAMLDPGAAAGRLEVVNGSEPSMHGTLGSLSGKRGKRNTVPPSQVQPGGMTGSGQMAGQKKAFQNGLPW